MISEIIIITIWWRTRRTSYQSHPSWRLGAYGCGGQSTRNPTCHSEISAARS